MKYTFLIPYQTKMGEFLQIQTFNKGKEDQTYTLEYGPSYWTIQFDKEPKFDAYFYQVYNEYSGDIRKEFGKRKFYPASTKKEVQIFDFWNKANFPENYLLKPFFILPKKKYANVKPTAKSTHLICMKAAVPEDAELVISGNDISLGNWDVTKAKPLKQTDYGHWEIALDLSKVNHTLQFKFGIKTGDNLQLEEGKNRLMESNNSADKLYVYNEVYYHYSAHQLPKKAGLAIPVFSIRTKDGMGVGEFADMKKMGDWMQPLGMSILQVLPINDTIAQHNWHDCYPYAAISVYGLNPFYISIKNLQVPLTAAEKKQIDKDAEELNALELIDLDKVMAAKWNWLKVLYGKHQQEIWKNAKFKKFLKDNEDWLYAYAVFCVLRDENKTADFSKWNKLSAYNEKRVKEFFNAKNPQYADAMFYAWIQFELDAQLTDAIDYLHQKDIKVKGDLPIGIFRHSVEAWKEPELFGMEFQAGAPPDDFAVLGQNWEFPTYNWELMQKDGLMWWKSRFQALNKYFDAMRIDHILGFFRIWRIPKDAVQGIMGYFYPAIPITEQELYDRGIDYSYDRYCKPYINRQILNNQFGENANEVAEFFMESGDGYHYQFKEEYNTQRKLVNYLAKNPDYKDYQAQLLYLLSNVILIPEFQADTSVFHPRFNISSVESFHHLPLDQQQKLNVLYNDYFFMRQDGMWQTSAMEKLPNLLEATDMLICGEDLGMVPKSVPVVMDDLAILSLEVQRMTNDDRMYSDPAQAPYLSVVTPGTHDTSTIRQWWQEDRNVIQNYYNNQLHGFGEAPYEANANIMSQIIEQHLHSPAMLTVVPVQEWLAMTDETTNPNQDAERINIPAVFPHYWRYRMHEYVEDLMKNKPLNEKIETAIEESGRG